jgi:CPA2 family monovalent cation:H+ antiporter-2
LSLADVRVVSLRRGNGRVVDASDDVLLEVADTLVLSGKPAALAMAEEILLRGRSAKAGPAA